MQNFIIFCSLKFNLASKQLANDLQAALHKRNCNLLLIKRKRKRKKKVAHCAWPKKWYMKMALAKSIGWP